MGRHLRKGPDATSSGVGSEGQDDCELAPRLDCHVIVVQSQPARGGVTPRFLPEALRRQLSREGVQRAVSNFGWLSGGRLLRLLGGVFVMAWIARAIGPSEFGVLSHAAAFVGLFSVLLGLGTDAIVVREVVRNPDDAQVTLDSALAIRLGGLVLCLGLLAVVTSLVPFKDERSHAIILLASGVYVFTALHVPTLWFRAQTRSKPAVIATSTSYVVGLALKIAALLSGAALIVYAGIDVVAAALTLVLLLWAYRRQGRRLGLASSSRSVIRGLLREGWPLLIASMAMIVYMRIDVLMLEQLAGDDATRIVGEYAAATRLSEVWYFLPIAAVASLFPKIVQSKEIDESLYMSRVARLLSFMTLGTVITCVAMMFAAKPLVWFLFGPSYAAAGPILVVHVWALLFVSWNEVGRAWMITEGLTRLSMYHMGFGAIANVGLNLWLIPRHGGMGAAVSSLISYGCAAWLANALHAHTRLIFRAQLASLWLKGLR